MGLGCYLASLNGYPAHPGPAADQGGKHGRRPRHRNLRNLAAELRGRHPAGPRAGHQDPARRHLGLDQGPAGQARERPGRRVPGQHGGHLRPRRLARPRRSPGLSTARRMSRWASAGRSRHVQGWQRRLRLDGRGLHADGKGQGGQAGTMSHEELRTYTLAVVVEPAEGAWHAYCPTLLDYGAATWGATREEALEQIRAVATMIVQRMAEEKMP